MENHPLWIAGFFAFVFGSLALFFAGMNIVKTEFDDTNILWIMVGILLIMFGVIFIYLDHEFYNEAGKRNLVTTQSACLLKSPIIEIKKIHLFRPDLLPYPTPWETYS